MANSAFGNFALCFLTTRYSLLAIRFFRRINGEAAESGGPEQSLLRNSGAQQGTQRHQPRGPHHQCRPGGQRAPHRPPQAALWMGVKFCTAPLRVVLPRHVCASAVKAMEPATRMAVATMAVDSLRISSSVRSMRRPFWRLRA
jgi:hypothetical protein